ncbi:MAG: 3'(2'),5'-bisphosphate nucleotidase CysQ [Hyphomonadaceae bacterium]
MQRPDNSASSVPDALIVALEALARRAGAAILEVKRGGIHAEAKSDGSPVTAADLASNGVILEGLTQLLPLVPVITEEGEDGPKVLANPEGDFLLIDPLDGTREFVSGDPDYTVNIAYVRGRRPVVGIVYMPEKGVSWVGDSRADPSAAWQIDDKCIWSPIETRAAGDTLAVLTSRSHQDPATEAFLQKISVSELVRRGSSLKFCLIAAGKGDLYPRFGPTMEWDTAAGDGVLTAAGGAMLDLNGKAFLYGKMQEECRNCGFMAMGDPRLAATIF